MGQGGVKSRKERHIAFREPSLWRQHLKQMEWRVLAEKVKGELMEMRGNASASLQFPATDKEEKDIWPLGNSLIQIQPTTFYCQSYNFTNDMFRDQIYTCCLVEVLFIFNALKRSLLRFKFQSLFINWWSSKDLQSSGKIVSTLCFKFPNAMIHFLLLKSNRVKGTICFFELSFSLLH